MNHPGLALMIIGIAVYALLSPALGAVCFLVGLVLVVWPWATAGTSRRPR